MAIEPVGEGMGQATLTAGVGLSGGRSEAVRHQLVAWRDTGMRMARYEPVPSCDRALSKTASMSRYSTRSAAISMCMIGSLKSSASSGPGANTGRASCPCAASISLSCRLLLSLIYARARDRRPISRV